MNESQENSNRNFLEAFNQANSFNYVCSRPWETIEVDEDGGILVCCPGYTDRYHIGNIYETDFDEIWNGEKAKQFRKELLQCNYEHCKLGLCCNYNWLIAPANHSFTKDEIQNLGEIAAYPKIINVQVDKFCNAKCITCRDSIYKMEKKDKDFYFNTFIPKILSVLKGAEVMGLNGLGDVFCSPVCKKLITEAGKLYPSLKFDIWTNGINLTPLTYHLYHLHNRVKNVAISLHSATEETHDKIFRTGRKDFKKVIKNLEWIVKKRDNKEIETITINFVVHKINYKEMIAFQELANKYNVVANYSEYRPWYNAKMAYQYDEMAIFLPEHPEYDKYAEIAKNDIFNSPNCIFPVNLRAKS